MTRSLKHLPRQPRIDTHYSALLIASDGLEMEVVVLDLSSDGFRLQAKGELSIGEAIFVGEHVRLRIARYGDFPAEVRWTLGAEAGGVFLAQVGDLED